MLKWQLPQHFFQSLSVQKTENLVTVGEALVKCKINAHGFLILFFANKNLKVMHIFVFIPCDTVKQSSQTKH